MRDSKLSACHTRTTDITSGHIDVLLAEFQPLPCVPTLLGVILLEPLNALLPILWPSEPLSFKFSKLGVAHEVDEVRTK